MSGLKPPELSAFYRMLRQRDIDGQAVTTQVLADKVGVSRAAVCRVLNGARRRGPIWAKVAALLTAEERQLLDVAHCHPWNKKRVARRPKWAKVAKQFEQGNSGARAVA